MSGLWRAGRKSAERDSAPKHLVLNGRSREPAWYRWLSRPSRGAPGKHRTTTAPTRFAFDVAEHSPDAISGLPVRSHEPGLHPAGQPPRARPGERCNARDRRSDRHPGRQCGATWRRRDGTGDLRREGGARPTGRRERATEGSGARGRAAPPPGQRSEEHTSELQSLTNLVCRLLLEKKKKKKKKPMLRKEKNKTNKNKI